MVVEILFWSSVALLAYTHAGYPLVLRLLVVLRRRGAGDARPSPFARAAADADLPPVSLIVAAHDEERAIEAKVRNALELDYPRDRLQVIVASDGSRDRTVELARRAGAELVLDLPRRGKIAAQNAAVLRARGEVLAFSDANSIWEPEALRLLVAALLAGPRVGYACGQVRLVLPTKKDGGGTSQEGAYWRYELSIRALESRLAGITSGNGAIYATRRETYLRVDPRMGHDLSFPFKLVKRGWRPVYVPAARASEKAIPSAVGEYRRKRRIAKYVWLITVRGGMLSPRGYGPLYAFQILSHRVLRYLTPFLHLIALGANVALLGRGTVYAVTLALQGALLAAAALGPFVPVRALRLAHHYVLVTAALAAGLWDLVRRGAPTVWETPQEAR